MKWLGENDKRQAEIHLPVALDCKRSRTQILQILQINSLTPKAGDLMQCRVRVILVDPGVSAAMSGLGVIPESQFAFSSLLSKLPISPLNFLMPQSLRDARRRLVAANRS
jgi:hypothetical protein